MKNSKDLRKYIEFINVQFLSLVKIFISYIN